MKKKQLKKKYQIILIIAFTSLFLSLLIFSLIKIFNWNNDNNKTKRIKKDIIEDAVIVKKDETEIDFKKLKETNSDTVAYIIIPNTKISYPIVKGNNNDYYLNHSFDKKYNEAGWIFANYENRFDGTDKNISIFGHNRLNGSMFGTLKKTLSKSWQQDSNNHEISFMTEEGKYKYLVFSTYKIKAEDYYIKSSFDSNEFGDFVNTLKSRSNYNYNVEVGNDDKIITLSTCDINNDYRIVLHAKLIEN